MAVYVLTSILLFVVCSLLVIRQWHLKRQLMLVTARIHEISKGALNQRIRIHTTQPILNDLGGSMNRLIDDFQQSMEKVNLLESERKKIITHLSHDLRTPLTAMLGYVEVMQQDNTLPEATRQHYFQIISNKGHKLDALIRDFFELSKLEADDGPLESEKINLLDKMQEAVLSFYQQFRHAQITPQLQFPERPVYVWGNGQSIERIMNNLLSNSLRYGTAGGMIGIQIREEGERIWVDVWDRGKGISEVDLPHIFERLYTGKASRDAVQQGNGLGLTIVKKLVDKQQGEIHVHSIPDEKTCFSFCLPKTA
ncbi:sensor histidine kinase [Paenibacillus radicis (ex Xue et al. 2023)]|uniref:histidine kinase n=1 Tax=Paenibacillus radicis (ex Xue et al. 2023) TaxID=2972489 RepID=A0ABT1YQZ5_9BACL|nr:HAMP domain-containing sensor histidine kinase [Paenibacillus radicis (ex Xue et al. 2023)]MCR8634784.1 HAMP domain-containing histidine kinase [Paenibacillus radicis (ex Xue et al. 2023)]